MSEGFSSILDDVSQTIGTVLTGMLIAAGLLLPIIWGLGLAMQCIQLKYHEFFKHRYNKWRDEAWPEGERTRTEDSLVVGWLSGFFICFGFLSFVPMLWLIIAHVFTDGCDESLSNAPANYSFLELLLTFFVNEYFLVGMFAVLATTATIAFVWCAFVDLIFTLGLFLLGNPEADREYNFGGTRRKDLNAYYNTAKAQPF